MKISRFIAVLLLFLLGLFLLLHNYAIYPQRGATGDEYAFAFLGTSLLTHGEPTSWSHFEVYTNRHDIVIDKMFFPIVTPYLDHPPLFGLMVGGLALLAGENSFEAIKLSTIRLVSITLTAISSFFVFLIGNRLFGFKTGLWTLLIFTTTTIFVINARMVVAETLVTTLLLATIYAYIRFGKTLTEKRLLLLGLLCGLAFLSKVAGVVVFFSLLYFLIEDNGKVQKLTMFAIPFFILLLSLVGYGLFFGGELFWKIQMLQGARHIGPENFWIILTTPIIVNKVVSDGWYILGFISLFLCFLDYQKYRLVIIPALFYLLFLVSSLTIEGRQGWYFLPLFPLMALAIAAQLSESIRSKNWYILLFLLVIGMYQMQYIYEASFGLVPIRFRILTLLIFILPLVSHLFKREKAFRWVSQFWFYLFILGNVFLTWNYVHPA